MNKPSDRAIVEPNDCACHPETCACAGYRLQLGDETLMTGSKGACERVAKLIDAAAPEGAQGAVAWRKVYGDGTTEAWRLMPVPPVVLEDANLRGWHRIEYAHPTITQPQPQDAARDREDAARYRELRRDPSMLLHLSNKEFDDAIDLRLKKKK